MSNYNFDLNLRKHLASWGNLLTANKDTSSKAVDSAEGSSDGQKISRREANSRILKSLFIGGLGASALAKKAPAQEINYEERVEIKKTPNELIDEGVKLYREKKYKEAIRNFDFAAEYYEKQPIEDATGEMIRKKALAYSNSAYSNLMMGNFSEAIVRFTKAIEIYEENPGINDKKGISELYYDRGKVSLYTLNLLGALRDCKKTFDLNPNNKEAKRLYSTLLGLNILGVAGLMSIYRIGVSKIALKRLKKAEEQRLLTMKMMEKQELRVKFKKELITIRDDLKKIEAFLEMIYVNSKDSQAIRSFLEGVEKLSPGSIVTEEEGPLFSELLKEINRIAEISRANEDLGVYKLLLKVSESLVNRKEIDSNLIKELNTKIQEVLKTSDDINSYSLTQFEGGYQEYLSLYSKELRVIGEAYSGGENSLMEFLDEHPINLLNEMHKNLIALGLKDDYLLEIKEYLKALLSINIQKELDKSADQGENFETTFFERLIVAFNDLSEEVNSEKNSVERVLKQANVEATRFNNEDMLKQNLNMVAYLGAINLSEAEQIKVFERTISSYESTLQGYTEEDNFEGAQAIKDKYGGQIEELKAKLKTMQ